jgi:hypothetical protein
MLRRLFNFKPPATWEIAAAGFSGDKDESDHLIYWLIGGDELLVRQLCDGTGAQWQPLDWTNDQLALAGGELDGRLDRDFAKLRKILLLHKQVNELMAQVAELKSRIDDHKDAALERSLRG